MQIHVWNYGTWIFYFIAIIYIARLLVSLWENNFIKQFAIAGIFPVTAGYIQPWWFLLLFLIIILSFVYYERFKFISRALTYLTVLFLIYFVCARFMPFLRFENIYIGRFSLFFFTALFIYLLFNKIINAKLSPQISKSIFLISTVIFIIFFDAAFLYKQHGVRINYRGYSKTDINPWVDVQLFARDHTPVDALFIVPPYLEGFTVFSRRSILGDWIIGTTCVWGDNSYAAEWLKRMKMLGWDCSRIVKDFKEVKDNYNSLSKEDILKVAKEYKASYVVFENAKRINLPIIYKNRLYSLYMINEEQNIHKDNEKAGESIRQIITPKDGAKMLLIPAGGFVMGSDKGEDDERPVHDVQLNAFYMDVYEVTNSKYCRFLNENKTSENRLKEWIDIDKDYILIVKSSKGFSAKPGYESYPAVGISWYGAQAYASWAGKRLPTEAEWEYASRGGLRDEQYSWGSQDPSDGARANYNCAKDGYDGVSPAGSFPPNGYGLYDMAGNVWEWCSDWYNSNFYEWSSGFDNWNIILKGTFRVRRGGSCLTDAGSLRNAYRSFGKPLHKAMDVGFRCCR
jgi:formylglycine-generating enzyme required for sulfatase activity